MALILLFPLSLINQDISDKLYILKYQYITRYFTFNISITSTAEGTSSYLKQAYVVYTIV